MMRRGVNGAFGARVGAVASLGAAHRLLRWWAVVAVLELLVGGTAVAQTFVTPIDDWDVSWSYAREDENGYHAGIDAVRAGLGDQYLAQREVAVRAAYNGVVHQVLGLEIDAPTHWLRRWDPATDMFSWTPAETPLPNHGLGQCVIVYHKALDKYTLYGHLDAVRLGLGVGDIVNKGEVIGRNGNSYHGYLRYCDSTDGHDHQTLCLATADAPPGWTADDIVVLHPKGFRPHVHFELKHFGDVGNLSNDGPKWAYTPGIPNLYGYLNPMPYLEFELHGLTPTAVTASSDPSVYTGPTSGYMLEVTTVKAGQQFAAFAEYDGRYQVHLPSTEGPGSGWIEATPDPEATLVRVHDPIDSAIGVRVRAGPGTTYSVLSKVWHEQWLVTSGGPTPGPGCSEDWHQIDLAGNADADSGWACGEYLVPDSGRDVFANGDSTFVEPDPGGCDRWTSQAPGPRSGHAMAYDVARQRVVVFGGYGGDHLGDTWEWDGATWTLMATDGPSPRSRHAMAYDAARQRVVLFGGYGGYLGDTWEWDGAAWKLVATDGPSGRYDHAMAYDAVHQRVVLFGGYDNSYTQRGDTWAWDGASWTLVATDGPSPRGSHAMACDSARQRVVLFGGEDNSGSRLDDTWEWDGAAWTLVASNGPSSRYRHATAYDALRQRVVLFGGEIDWDSRLSDTWEWDGAAWTRVATAGPSPRSGHAMVYDSTHQRVVLFGGHGHGVDYRARGDTWEWSGDTWTLRGADGPSPRRSHMMAYDGARQRVVLYGGHNYSGRLSDTWEWDGLGWMLMSNGGPSRRHEHAMAYDAARQRVVLFGGSYDSFGTVLRGDTWEWDGAVWALVATDGPSPRYKHAMAYDAARQRVILFGGNDGSQLGDTWEWDGAAWTPVATDGPSPRDDHAMAYDAARDRVVLFGGSPDGFYRLGDTWEWDGSVWAHVATDGSLERYNHALVYDGTRQRVVLFGGNPWGGPDDDTWEWDGTAWRLIATGGPSPRDRHAMAYDAERRRLVLFGGMWRDPVGDTWEFGCPDRSRSDWARDGLITVADLAAFLTDWGAGQADFNGDGVTDTRDVVEFLQDWSVDR